jgi:hypothetical protein
MALILIGRYRVTISIALPDLMAMKETFWGQIVSFGLVITI